jgi:hypothetical protein
MSYPAPRPILKHNRTTLPPRYPLPPQQAQVHFPPSPILSRTFAALPASTYDRSPIVVAPNTCALPERGCPGRTYYSHDDTTPKTSPRSSSFPASSQYSSSLRNLLPPSNGKTIHPRAAAVALPPALSSTTGVPALIPDLSSESDESDGFAPAQHKHALSYTPRQYYAPPIPSGNGRDKYPPAHAHGNGATSYPQRGPSHASFPSPPPPPSYYGSPPEKEHHRHRQPRRERSRERSRSAVRLIREAEAEGEGEGDDDDESRDLSIIRASNPPLSPHHRHRKTSSHAHSYKSTREHSGCLDGF